MSAPAPRRARVARLLAAVGLLAGLAASAGPVQAADDGTYPGSLPDTASAVTYCVVAADAPLDPDAGCTHKQHGTADFVGLRIHVNQTAQLVSQAVSVTYQWPDRATATVRGGQFVNTYGTNYLQLMQCWGGAVTTGGATTGYDAAQAGVNFNAENNGPPREQCEYGGAAQAGVTALGGGAAGRTTGAASTTKPPASIGAETAYDAGSSTVSVSGADIPFKAYDGTVIPHQVTKLDSGVPVYSNTYYDQTTTNEAPANYVFAGSNGAPGSGGIAFSAQNSVDASGLGCGTGATADAPANRCWLVIVPRGSNDIKGKPINTQLQSAFASPLASTLWANRIAIPLDFLPTASACDQSTSPVPTSGSELVAAAMLSWSAQLCGSQDLTFNYTAGVDAVSRQNLLGIDPATGAAGANSLQFVSDPLPNDQATTPVTYAPVTLSGVTVSAVWDAATGSGGTPGKPIAQINLTPRLLAKLLTYSYKQANPYRIDANASGQKPPPADYAWLADNPLWLGSDPEFLAANPGLPTDLYSGGDPIASVQVELNGSDAASRVWQYILADPDAQAFLAGTTAPHPDPVKVDPYYSTDPAKNPTGAAFVPADTLPNNDPWQGFPRTTTPCTDQGQYALTMLDIRPYADSLSAVARNLLANNSLEKWTAGYRCTEEPHGYYSSRPVGPVVPGQRSIMGLTDLASSRQFGQVNVSLQNAAGQFVAPTDESVAAAAAHLAPTGVQGVDQPDLTTKDPAAYPLAMIGYAAVTTNAVSTSDCAAYAALLDYAAGDGQNPGQDRGELPAGYVPLPTALRTQTAAAARTVAACTKDAPAQGSADPGTVDDTTGTDLGSGGTSFSGDDVPADAAAQAAAAAAAGSPQVSLSASTRRTSEDPNVFAYVVPIAFLVGLAALLAAPLASVRRRRSANPAGPSGPAGPPGGG